MPDPRTDQIAREAARLIQTGRADDIAVALRRAAEALGYADVPLPGRMRVRQHAQAMAMQAMGANGYQKKRVRMWEIAEQIMTLLEHAFPDARSVLTGRAAAGHFDAGVTVHIRLYTRAAIGDIAQVLVEFGHEEPTFDTVETRFGRLNQVRFMEEDFEVAVTCCLPELQPEVGMDLVTGKPIETMTLLELRRRLDEPTS